MWADHHHIPSPIEPMIVDNRASSRAVALWLSRVRGGRRSVRPILALEGVLFMCGIIGVTSNQPVAPKLADGVRRLEYRGYDSAGLAVLNANSGDINKRWTDS